MFFSPSGVMNVYQRYTIGTIFNIICFLGILAGIYPAKCSKKNLMQNPNVEADFISKDFKGHHPNCEKYFSHLIIYNGRHFCAGCVGLITGGIVALIGSILYFYFNTFYLLSEINILLGLILIPLGLIQHKIDFDNPILHAALNIGFVVGSFLLLISLDYFVTNFFYDLYLLGIIIFWINTRIQLSQYDHYTICKSCNDHCILSL
jgi:hypothetical protein